MRSQHMPFTIVAALLTPTLAPVPARSQAKDEILQIIPSIDAAIKSHDSKKLSAIFDPGGKFVTEEGAICDQKKYVASLADPSITYKTVKSNYTSLRYFGDTAVEMGTFHAVGTQKGKRIVTAVRYISVWAKKNGKWVITAEQGTNAPKTKQ